MWKNYLLCIFCFNQTGDNDTKFGNLVAEELRKIMDATKKEDVKSQIKNVLKIKEA